MREPAFWWDPDGGPGGSAPSPASTGWRRRCACGRRGAGRRAGDLSRQPNRRRRRQNAGSARGRAHAARRARTALFPDAAAMADAWPGRCGSILRGIRPTAVGDEPLSAGAARADHRVRAIAWRAAEAARRDGATVIVMDDGFQNPSLTKDLAMSCRRRPPRHRQWPNSPGGTVAGAARDAESEYAHAIIVVGPADGVAAGHRSRGSPHGVAIFHGRLEPDRRHDRCRRPARRSSPLRASAIRRNFSPHCSKPASRSPSGSASPITTATRQSEARALLARRRRELRAAHHGEGLGPAQATSPSSGARRSRQCVAGPAC